MSVTINGDTGIDKIQPGTVEASDIPDSTITGAKLADDTITHTKIADATIIADKLADAAVTDAKIAGMSSSKLTGALPAIDGSALTGLGGGGFSNMQVFTSPGTWTNPGSVSTVKVTVVGGGGGAKYNGYNPSNAGGTSSFGAFCSATGGAGAYYTPSQNYAEGGIGVGGNLNLHGGNASLAVQKGGDSSMGFGAVAANPGSYTATKNAAGFGGGGVARLITPAGSMHGGGGGTAIEYIDGASIPGPVAVTVGSAGTANMPAPLINPGLYIASAGDGIVIVEY